MVERSVYGPLVTGVMGRPLIESNSAADDKEAISITKRQTSTEFAILLLGSLINSHWLLERSDKMN